MQAPSSIGSPSNAIQAQNLVSYKELSDYEKNQSRLQKVIETTARDTTHKLRDRHNITLGAFDELSAAQCALLLEQRHLLTENGDVLTENASLRKSYDPLHEAVMAMLSAKEVNSRKQAYKELTRVVDKLPKSLSNKAPDPSRLEHNWVLKGSEPLLPRPPIQAKIVNIAEKLSQLKEELQAFLTEVKGGDNPGQKEKLADFRATFAALELQSKPCNEITNKCLVEMLEQGKTLATVSAPLITERADVEWMLNFLETTVGIVTDLTTFYAKLDEFQTRRRKLRVDIQNQFDPKPRLDEFKVTFTPLKDEWEFLHADINDLKKRAGERIIQLEDFIRPYKEDAPLQKQVDARNIVDENLRTQLTQEAGTRTTEILQKTADLLETLSASWQKVRTLADDVEVKVGQIQVGLYDKNGWLPPASGHHVPNAPMVGWSLKDAFPERKTEEDSVMVEEVKKD